MEHNFESTRESSGSGTKKKANLVADDELLLIGEIRIEDIDIVSVL